MTSPDPRPEPAPSSAGLSPEAEAALRARGTRVLARMTDVNHALNLLGHAMSCGREKTQRAAYDELLDAFAEMTSAWNARQELTAAGVTVAQDESDDKPGWGES